MLKAKVKYTPKPLVIRAAQDAAEVIGKRFGSYVQRSARQSIRRGPKSGKPSSPGKPPRSKTGALKANIRWAYDPTSRSVVIGPTLLSDKEGKDSPEAMEKGGSSRAVSYIGGKRVRRRQRVAARPFMLPALQKRAPELPGLWKNSIKQ